MKKSLLCFILVIVFMPSISNAQKSLKGSAKQSNKSNSNIKTFAASSNFYKHFSSVKASNLKVTLDISCIDSLLSAYYFDNSLDTYVYLNGLLSKNKSFKLNYTDGRTANIKKSEIKNFKINGSFISDDSISIQINKAGNEKINLTLISDYAHSLPLDHFSKTISASIKGKGAEAKYNFSMSVLTPKVSIFSDTILNTFKRIVSPSKFKQLKETNLQLIEKLQTEEQVNWKKSNAAFTTGKQKTPQNLERVDKMDVFFNASDIICFTVNSYLDNGGMHPNSNEYFRCFDLLTKKQIQLKDVFIDSYKQKLPKLLASSCLNEYNLLNSKKYSKLTEIDLPEELPIPTEFGINQKGMFFIYNSGDLDPSYTNKLVIFVTINELKSLINPRGIFSKLE